MSGFDANLLRLMKTRKNFNRYRRQLDESVVSKATIAVLDDFDRYYKEYPSHDKIDFQLFGPRMKVWNQSTDDQELAVQTLAVKAAAKGTITKEVEESLQNEIANQHLSNRLRTLGEQHADGDLPDFGLKVREAMAEHKKLAAKPKADWIDRDIGDILSEEADESGYDWRLNCLREGMRGLRAGDFGIVAARPDKGKTTFLAGEATFMAPQMPDDQNIIWLNNEGPGSRIVPRLYQAALGIGREEMLRLNAEGELTKRYADVVGRPDRIRVMDIHRTHATRVEALLESANAGIVIYDMIDNIGWGNGGAARHEMLEEMYQWAREISVGIGFAGIATSQISAEGDGEMYPGMSMLKDSKTGKQGACDFQIHIGASNDPSLQSLRYIGTPKNKLRREGARTIKGTAQFLPHIARYDDNFNEE
jgi:replicative DNA helicase